MTMITWGHGGEDCVTDRGQVCRVRGRGRHLVKGVCSVDVVSPKLLHHLGQEKPPNPLEKGVPWIQQVGAGVGAVEMAPWIQLRHVCFRIKSAEKSEKVIRPTTVIPLPPKSVGILTWKCWTYLHIHPHSGHLKITWWFLEAQSQRRLAKQESFQEPSSDPKF